MSEPTPRPWTTLRDDPRTIVSGKDEDGCPFVMAVAAGGRVFPPRKRSEPSRTTAEANAALIVHAVNCHDELVTALEYVFDHIADKNRGPRDLYPAFGLDAGRALEMVRAAIAKARGEQ